MKEAGTMGSLLFISSKNGLVGASNKSLYCATKGGELALARALAKELGVFGIRVNTICPDAVLEGSSQSLGRRRLSPGHSQALQYP